MAGQTRDKFTWVRRGSALLLLAFGWLFILANNHFHATPSSIFIGLGYTAAVAAVYTLFRTGATAVAPYAEDLGAAEWGAPMGPRGELEREKRMLLKAIREAEFDHEMGKLSKADADQMIGTYRARAIAIIKQLDSVEGELASTRSQIEKEVRARLEVERPKTKAKAKAGGSKGKAAKPGDKAATPGDKAATPGDKPAGAKAPATAVAAATAVDATESADAAESDDEAADARDSEARTYDDSTTTADAPTAAKESA